MLSFKQFYLESMNRRSFIGSLAKGVVGLTAFSKVTPASFGPGTVVLDSDFNITNIVPGAAEDMSEFDYIVSLCKGIKISPIEQIPSGMWTLHVNNIPKNVYTMVNSKFGSHANIAPQFRGVFKPLAKKAYETTYADESFIDQYYGDEGIFETMDWDKPEETITELKGDIARYEKITGNSMPEKAHRAISDCIDRINQAIASENKLRDRDKKGVTEILKVPVKFSAHHHTSVKYSPTSTEDDIEDSNVRSVGESTKYTYVKSR